jgi:hypothetical protein
MWITRPPRKIIINLRREVPIPIREIFQNGSISSSVHSNSTRLIDKKKSKKKKKESVGGWVCVEMFM